ncbi:MAG: sugar ABC transporter ATP-binding protein [Planctomycetota bacterium]
MTPPRLQLSHVSKRFGNTAALCDVGLSVHPGETVAVIGENGAGKSTLMKILAGVVTPDAGELRIDGQVVADNRTFARRGPREAMAQGIALIHQELNLHHNLSVAENLFLGREPSHCGWLNRNRMRRESARWLDRVGLDLSPDTEVAGLPIASQQLIEIARALSMDANVVIMDEPTSSLSDEEATRLFGLIRELESDGVSILYISHRMGEITRLAHRVEVLRDGCHVGTLVDDEIQSDVMVQRMVGRELTPTTRQTASCDEVILSVNDLRVGSRSAPSINFSVHAGEVVVLVGLVGAGRTEIVEAIFGIRDRCGGQVRMGDDTVGAGPRDAIAAGMGLVPEDRKTAGLLLNSSVRDNTTMTAMMRHTHWGSIDRRWQRRATATLIDQLGIKAASPLVEAAALSGGNQQKVVLGKWLHDPTRVLLLDEPTRGVDIGAKAEIYRLIADWVRQTDRANGVLAVSSEMEEVFAIADRVLVVAEGQITGELARHELSEEAIMRLAVPQS